LNSRCLRSYCSLHSYLLVSPIFLYIMFFVGYLYALSAPVLNTETDFLVIAEDLWIVNAQDHIVPSTLSYRFVIFIYRSVCYFLREQTHFWICACNSFLLQARITPGSACTPGRHYQKVVFPCIFSFKINIQNFNCQRVQINI